VSKPYRERKTGVAGNGIGEELRRERLRQGLTLDDIVQRTRISPRYLEAIEDSAFDRLPGLVFTRNFVRLYALDLKLDADSLVSRLPRVDIESAPPPNPPARAGRNPWDPRVKAALASVLWLATAAGAGAGGWYYFTHYEHHTPRVAATQAPAHHPAQPAVQQPAALQEPVQNASVAAAATGSESASNQQAAASLITPTAALSEPQGYDPSRPVQVVLTAHEAAWVQVSADGRTAFVGLLHPNDKRAISADAQVKVLTGNAGGIDISLNGKPLDPIGPKGQVRTIRLTAEGPQFGPQNPPASSPL
jgi:cytoskeletal protein RodZ